MLYLGYRAVRQSWMLYVGAFVALALGTLLLGLAATTTAATVAYTSKRPGGLLVTVTGDDRATHQERYGGGGDDVAGLQAVLSMVGAISGFVTIFVVASTFAFVVAARRRELGLLRLIGLTPRQIRRMIRGEALTVALLASLCGALAAQLVTPFLLDAVAGTSLSPAHLHPASPWLPLAITTVTGVLVALLGARAAAKRAAKVPPVEALREASIEPRRLGVLRASFGVLFAAGGIAMLVFIRPSSGEAAIPLAMFTPMIFVVALVALAPVVVPPLARLWALPLLRWTKVSGHLARGTVVASPRRAASLAAPILGMSAIAGSMVLTFGFAADASYGAMLHGISAPVVVTSSSSSSSSSSDDDLTQQLRSTPGVGGLDVSIPVEVVMTDRGAAVGEDAEGIDPSTFTRARHLPSLSSLTGNTVAVSKEMHQWEGYDVGETLSLTFLDGSAVKLRIVAVVDAPPEVIAAIMLPKALAARHAPDAVPSRWFVWPAPGVSASELLPTLPGQARTVAEWAADSNAELRKGNQLGLLILLGPAGFYSALTIANTLLMGSLQRRREYITTRLLGATSAQVRRTVLWEAGLVATVALTLGAVVTTVVGLLVRSALTSGQPDVETTVPWLTLAGITVGSLAIAVLAAVLPTSAMLRRTRPADAVAG